MNNEQNITGNSMYCDLDEHLVNTQGLVIRIQ